MSDDILHNCLWNGEETAPAKLNLGLKITGHRPDGYHLLESLFWPINLCDRLIFSLANNRESDDVRVTSEFPTSPIVGEENIVAKALVGTRRLVAVPALSVRIQKKIPIGAGLGGGSSNGAAALRFVARQVSVDAPSITALGLKLGADVPYFLNSSSPAWVTGIGETTLSLNISSSVAENLRFLLLFPPFQSSTAAVFGLYRESRSQFSRSQPPPFEGTISEHSLKSYLATLGNDLLPFVTDPEGLLKTSLAALQNAGAINTSMSGSGSTLFGVFWGQGQVVLAAKELQPFCRRTSCRLVIASTYGS